MDSIRAPRHAHRGGQDRRSSRTATFKIVEVGHDNVADRRHLNTEYRISQRRGYGASRERTRSERACRHAREIVDRNIDGAGAGDPLEIDAIGIGSRAERDCLKDRARRGTRTCSAVCRQRRRRVCCAVNPNGIERSSGPYRDPRSRLSLVTRPKRRISPRLFNRIAVVRANTRKAGCDLKEQPIRRRAIFDRRSRERC